MSLTTQFGGLTHGMNMRCSCVSSTQLSEHAHHYRLTVLSYMHSKQAIIKCLSHFGSARLNGKDPKLCLYSFLCCCTLRRSQNFRSLKTPSKLNTLLAPTEKQSAMKTYRNLYPRLKQIHKQKRLLHSQTLNSMSDIAKCITTHQFLAAWWAVWEPCA